MAAAPTDQPTPEPNDDAALARYWLAEIDTAEKDKDRQTWLKRAKEIVRLYTDKRATDVRTAKRFALFWSNIEVLKPATISRVPEPVVSRRFKDPDPVGRHASEVLERCLKFSVDSYDFAGTLFGCRDEFLLLARAVPWIRYIPHIKTKGGEAKSDEIAPDGEGYEVVEWEETRADYVNYADFLTNVARQWTEVTWVCRIAFMTRDELVDRFGEEKGRKVALDWAPDGQPDAADNRKKACIYEVWDRKTKQALWLSKGCSDYPLDVKPDPLKLRDFFPCPKPALGTISPDSLIPIPDYIYYQDQCDEIDTLTARIGKLIEALKVRGFYSAKDGTNLNTLLSSDDNTLIPVDSWAALGDSGGLKGIIEWMPLDVIAGTLKQCTETRQQIISDVYQITGISDIQRGDTDPDETASAQQMKASFGSARVHERKKEMARLARDCLDLKAQVIASQFDQKTLADMSDVKLLTNAEKAQIGQQMQVFQAYQAQAQAMQPQPGQPPPQMGPPPPQPPPAQMALMSEPSWEEVIALLRSPTMRAFRIDVETDSTIEPNDQEEKQRRIEFVEAVGQFLANSLPVVQAVPAVLPVITQGLLFLVRGFRVGREMEDVIENAMEQLAGSAQQGPPQPQGPDPQAEQAKAQAAVITAKASEALVQNDAQANQIEAMRVQSDHAIGMAQVQAENQRTHVDAATKIHDTIAKAADRRAVREINNSAPTKAGTP